jgi:hypothetical protein
MIDKWSAAGYPFIRGDHLLFHSRQATMAILMTCQCGKPVRASAHYVGKQGRCPNCGHIIQVTAPPAGAALRSAQETAEDATYDVPRETEVQAPASIPVWRRQKVLLLGAGSLILTVAAVTATLLVWRGWEEKRRPSVASAPLVGGAPRMGTLEVRAHMGDGAPPAVVGVSAVEGRGREPTAVAVGVRPPAGVGTPPARRPVTAEALRDPRVIAGIAGIRLR